MDKENKKHSVIQTIEHFKKENYSYAFIKLANNDMFGIILNSQKIICNTARQIPKFSVEVYGGNPYMKGGHTNFFTDVVYGNKCGSFKKYKEAFF